MNVFWIFPSLVFGWNKSVKLVSAKWTKCRLKHMYTTYFIATTKCITSNYPKLLIEQTTHMNAWQHIHSRGPFNGRFFHHNSNSMKISFRSYPSCTKMIAMKCCPWHDSCAVVPCAIYCSDIISHNGVKLKPIFHRICITLKKIVREKGPEHNLLRSQLLMNHITSSSKMTWHR